MSQSTSMLGRVAHILPWKSVACTELQTLRLAIASVFEYTMPAFFIAVHRKPPVRHIADRYRTIGQVSLCAKPLHIR
jgi:hypothetical protein